MLYLINLKVSIFAFYFFAKLGQDQSGQFRGILDCKAMGCKMYRLVFCKGSQSRQVFYMVFRNIYTFDDYRPGHNLSDINNLV